jgi:hypothetical protein
MNSFSAGVTFEPKLIGLTSKTGSAAGAVIQAKIQGAGTADQLMLIDDSNDDMCTTATVIRYGVLECHVNSDRDYSVGTSVRVKDINGDAAYECANDVLSECQY